MARLQRGRIARTASPKINGEGTYLITGGLGGLGLHAARWLVACGARRLMLIGRTAPSPSAAAAVAELTRSGATIDVRAADVSQRSDVDRVLAELQSPLRGVIHAAGVLADSVIIQMSDEQFWRPMR